MYWKTTLIILLAELGAVQCGKNKKRQCAASCSQLPPGRYPSCNGCNKYVTCQDVSGTISMTETLCPPGNEWDDNKRDCSYGRSPTCLLVNPTPTTTATTTTTLTSSTITDTTTIQTPSVADCPNKGLLDGVLPCGYAILIGLLIASIPIVVLWLYKRCQAKSDTQSMRTVRDMVSVSTQTHEHRSHDDGDSAIYEEITPSHGSHDSRYTTPQYATCNNYQQLRNNYQVLNPSMYEQPNNQANPYLELHGYAILQSQDSDVRREVDKALIPIIMNLVDKYKNKPREYIQLENELVKFGKKN